MQTHTLQHFIKLTFKPVLTAAALASMLSVSGCSLFGVYKIDLAQGTPITQVQAQKIEPGMTQGQVLYLLGTPALRDTLAPNRWDYIYDYVPGTDGRREGMKPVQNASQHFIIYFDDSGTVIRTEGVQTLPYNN